MALIVGVSGKISHGKDAIAAHLARRYGFVRVGWADELKTEVSTRLRETVKAVTAMDEAMGNLPRLPPELHYPLVGEPSEAWWTSRIGYALNGERSPACRALLQEFGTQVRRADYDDYWLDAWERRVARMHGPEALGADSALRVVVPDTRFPNEAGRLLKHNATLIRVERPGLAPGPMAHHISETALDEWARWDLRIENVGTLADLHRALNKWAHAGGLG